MRERGGGEGGVGVGKGLRRHGGSEVSNYFGNYSKISGWRVVPGLVGRRPAILVRNPGEPAAKPSYFILLEWADSRLLTIRDFRYARYVIAEAELLIAE